VQPVHSVHDQGSRVAEEHDILGPVISQSVSAAARQSLKRTFDMFVGNHDVRRPDDQTATEKMMRIKMFDEYEHIRNVPDQVTQDFKLPIATKESREALPSNISGMLMDVGTTSSPSGTAAAPGPLAPLPKESQVQVTLARNRPSIPKPVWHPPWKLMRVISGHEGWVRTVAVDATNQWFASGGNDRLIKIWDLASGTLKLSLTGHTNAVRQVAISDRHPYLFSASEDCEVKCWDLEQNMAVRNYHGHLSGVYCVCLHPTLNIIATGGRDSTVRVWDMRTKHAVHVFGGHTNAVNSIISQAAEPQFVSGSMDHMVRLWDLAAGKCSVTLTNHKKSIRAMAFHPSEYTFVSCSVDNNKVWKCPRGAFERNISGHNAIVNSCTIRETSRGSVLIAGTDTGYLHFTDWNSGHKFQSLEAIPQPGSMSAENGIFALTLDQSASRLITAECDKTIKVYREDPNATEETHPLTWRPGKMTPETRY